MASSEPQSPRQTTTDGSDGPGTTSRRAERAADLCALLIVSASGVLVASSLAEIQYVPSADEGHYLGYARWLGNEGIGSYRELFQGYVSDSTRWLYPNPLRMAYLALATLWTQVRGVSLESLSELSLVAHVLGVGACYIFARRSLGNPRALFATALLAFSPLWMALARRALQDTTATLASVLAIWSFYEAVRAPHERRRRVLFMLAFGLGILVKETIVLLAIPLTAWVLFERYGRRASFSLAPFALALALPGAACALFWLLVAGDPGVLLRLVEIILFSPEGNPHAQRFGGGPWYRYLIDFLLLSPWPTLLAIGGFTALALRLRRDGTDSAPMYHALLLAGLLLAYSAFTKNVRYVAVLELPLRILAVYTLWELSRAAAPRRRMAVCGVAVALLCWLDYQTFQLIFVQHGLYDPVSTPLLAIRGMLPSE